MIHYFKYRWNPTAQEWYCEREITQEQFEHQYLQYWNHIRRSLGR
jgi:hypothetical protein